MLQEMGVRMNNLNICTRKQLCTGTYPPRAGGKGTAGTAMAVLVFEGE